MDADNLQRWSSHFKIATENIPVPPPSSLSTATSPWLKSPFSAVSTRVNLTRNMLTVPSLPWLQMFVFRSWQSGGSKI